MKGNPQQSLFGAEGNERADVQEGSRLDGRAGVDEYAPGLGEDEEP